MLIKNKSPGPRVFNIVGGAPGVVLQHTLMPGQTADLNLVDGPDKDFALKAWFDSGEVEEVSAKDAKLKAVGFDPDELAKAEAELAKLQEKVSALTAARQEAELDVARRSPPRQFGGDGGPQQSGTVDGQGGDLTPEQEKHGRPELPPADAAKALQERHAAAAAAAEDKAKADAAKAKK